MKLSQYSKIKLPYSTPFNPLLSTILITDRNESRQSASPYIKLHALFEAKTKICIKFIRPASANDTEHQVTKNSTVGGTTKGTTKSRLVLTDRWKSVIGPGVLIDAVLVIDISSLSTTFITRCTRKFPYASRTARLSICFTLNRPRFAIEVFGL